VTRLRNGQRTSVVRFAARKESILFPKVPTPVLGALSSGLKRPGRSIYHSLLSRVDYESDWCHISTPPSSFKACTGTNTRLCYGTVRLVSSLSPRRTGFDPTQFQVGIMVDKVTPEQIFSEHFSYPLSVSFHQRSSFHSFMSSTLHVLNNLQRH
jgi:hypothetical protein